MFGDSFSNAVSSVADRVSSAVDSLVSSARDILMSDYGDNTYEIIAPAPAPAPLPAARDNLVTSYYDVPLWTNRF
jgi:hypothetical protein